MGSDPDFPKNTKNRDRPYFSPGEKMGSVPVFAVADRLARWLAYAGMALLCGAMLVQIRSEERRGG